VTTYDFAIIGAGIAGASLAAELTDGGASVLLLEAEDRPGYHATGRSAAFWEECYGGPEIVPLTLASGAYLRDGGFLNQRGALYIGREGDEELVTQFMQRFVPTGATIQHLGRAELQRRIGGIRHDWSDAIWEPMCADIDVAALHAHYLARMRAAGAQLECRARVSGLKRDGGRWEIATDRGAAHHAATIVNAAGAWADHIGGLAGAASIGLVAKRRTAIIVEATPGYLIGSLPCVDFAATDAYIKPEAGMLMVSPGDATPITPQDVQPDELDVAILADWLERETMIPVRRIAHSWAGLRSFVPDDNPVVGFDLVAPGFVWCAGQGGYGIMMAPALARAVASLCLENGMPADFAASRITTRDLGPERFESNQMENAKM